MTVYFCLFFPWGKLFIHILFVQWCSVPIIHNVGVEHRERSHLQYHTGRGDPQKSKLQRSETVFVTESEQRI